MDDLIKEEPKNPEPVADEAPKQPVKITAQVRSRKELLAVRSMGGVATYKPHQGAREKARIVRNRLAEKLDYTASERAFAAAEQRRAAR